jgi:uncharacterized membrane protein
MSREDRHLSREEHGTIERLAPIQMLVVVFPGNRFRGEILPALDRLKHDHIVRVIDMLVVRKDPDGRTMLASASDLEWEEATALGAYLGSLAGFAAGGEEGMERGAIAGAAELADGHVFDADDIFRITQTLDNDTTVGLLLVQHTWATEFLDAVAAADGIEVLNTWVRPEAVLEIEAPAGHNEY